MNARSTITPPPLEKGDTIGVFAPSSWVGDNDIAAGMAFLEQQGFHVFIHPQTRARLHQAAGSAREKADAFHDLLKNPSIKAIIGARGGNRVMTILDKIDFDLIAQNPKIIMGYSDMTALLNAVHRKTGLVTYHGPLLRGIGARNPKDIERMRALLGAELPSFDFGDCRILREGTAEGALIGGNLSMLAALSGTPYQPDTRGAILFFEDAGDHLSRYDRMLAQMRLAGWFDAISGLIVGDFTKTEDDPARPFGFTLEDVIREHVEGLDIPLVVNAPFGHGERLCTLPIGGRATLNAHDGRVSFSLAR